MSETGKYPDFVTPKWVASKLALPDDEAAETAKKIAKVEDGWDSVTDKVTFAESFLDAHMADPSISNYCKQVRGKDSPCLFILPEDPDIEPPAATTPAKKIRGYFAECARSCAERGEDQKAIELAMLEMLEYGDQAKQAFVFAQEVQHIKKYAGLVETSKEIDTLARDLALVDKGLNPTEASGEAKAEVTRDYSISRLSYLADKAITDKDKVEALRAVASALAEAAGNTAAHMQISTAPLATVSAIATLQESVSLLEVQQKESEDEELSKHVAEVHTAASKVKDILVKRESACESRLKAEDVADLAKKASSQVKKAASMPVKNMADMKKMQEVFIKANQQAIEACKLATECASFIVKLAEEKPNDREADALFAKIEEAFRSARKSATQDVQASAKAAAEAQAQAQIFSQMAMASVTKEKESAAKKEPGVEEEVVDKTTARKELLTALKEFSSKRWDTNLATQTLKRLTDRRKEVIGQLWEAVETEDTNAPRLATKFVEQFNNSMDARRRLDAVVRLMGRGENLDPRTSKWFIDGIMKLAAAATVYQKAHV